MKKYLLSTISLALFFVLLGAGCGQATTPSNEAQPAQPSASVQEPSSESDDAGASDIEDTTVVVYTMEMVSSHNTKEDCWFVIDGKVYNVSEYARHPGGDVILDGCGKDATDLFETRPMGSGTPHSDKARLYLTNYKIGVLAQESETVPADSSADDASVDSADDLIDDSAEFGEEAMDEFEE